MKVNIKSLSTLFVLLSLLIPQVSKADDPPPILFAVVQKGNGSTLTVNSPLLSSIDVSRNGTQAGTQCAWTTEHIASGGTDTVTFKPKVNYEGDFTSTENVCAWSSGFDVIVYVLGHPSVTIDTASSGSVNINPFGTANANPAKTSADISRSTSGTESSSDSLSEHINLGCGNEHSDGTKTFTEYPGATYHIPEGYSAVATGGSLRVTSSDGMTPFTLESFTDSSISVTIGASSPSWQVDGPKVGGVLKLNPAVGDSVTFTNISYDPDNQLGTTARAGICTAAWTLTKPDATQTTGSNLTSFSFTPATPGHYTIALTVTDDEGATSNNTADVWVAPWTASGGCTGPSDPGCIQTACGGGNKFYAGVSPKTGNSSVRYQDPIDTRGAPLANRIYIDSQSRFSRSTPMGNAVFTYGMEVKEMPVASGGANHWVLFGPNGFALDFGATSGSPTNEAGVFSQFAAVMGGYELTGAGEPEHLYEAGNFKYEFDTSGKLYRITDPSGNIQEVTYDMSGYPIQVEDLDSQRLIEFEYDTPGVIARVVEASGVAVTHLTYSSGRMTEIRLEDQATNIIRELDISYNGNGKVSQIIQDNDSATTINFSYVDVGNGVYLANYTSSSGGSSLNYLTAPPAGIAYRTVRTNAQSGSVIYDFTAAGDLKYLRLPTLNGGSSGPLFTMTYTNHKLVTFSNGTNTYDLTYNSLGLLTQIDNNISGVWNYTYSGADLLTVADAVGTLLTLAYTDTNNPHSPTTLTDGNSKVWTYAYNLFGQITSITPPTGSPQSATTYDYEDNTASPIYGYLTSITNGASDLLEFTDYTALGDLTEMVSHPASGVTSISNFEYDAARRLKRITNPDATTVDYDYTGKDLTSITDEAGTQTDYTWCAICGKLTGVSLPLSKVLAWSQDTDHQVTGFTDARSNSTTYAYGNAGELKLVTYPDSSQTQIRYDNYTRVKKITTPRGREINYNYNTSGYVAQETFTTPSQTSHLFTYNADGTISSVSDTAGSTDYTYTGTKKLATVTYDYASLTPDQILYYTYNNDDSLYTLRWKNGSTDVVTWTYSYDGAGRLIQVSNTFGETVAYAYDGEGKILTQTNSNGTTTEYVYNEDRDWVTSITHKKSGTAIASYALTYDSGANTVGNLTGVTELDSSTVAYTYDALNRLTAETRTGTNSFSKSYAYDLAGNVTSLNGSTFATYDSANKFATLAGGGTFTYDSSGNLTALSGGGVAAGTYTWETRERMTKQTLTSSGAYGEYKIDWTAKRVYRKYDSTAANARWYVFNGDQLVGEVGTGGAAVAYTWGVDGLATTRIISSNTSLFHHYGPQGETRLLTNGSGTTQNTYTYSAYGVTIAASETYANRHRFGGKVGYYSDGPLGLILATHRWYSPDLMRWMSSDPIEYEGGDNLFSYVDGNPVTHLDPLGLEHHRGIVGDTETDEIVWNRNLKPFDGQGGGIDYPEWYEDPVDMGLILWGGLFRPKCPSIANNTLRFDRTGRWGKGLAARKGPHFHFDPFSDSNRLMKHHLPHQFRTWWKHFRAILREKAK